MEQGNACRELLPEDDGQDLGICMLNRRLDEFPNRGKANNRVCWIRRVFREG